MQADFFSEKNPERRVSAKAGFVTTSAILTGALAVLFLMALGGCAGRIPVTEKLNGGSTAQSGTVVNKSVASDLTRAAKNAMKKQRIEGLGIAVVADDGSNWSAGFGSAGNGRKIAPETPFYIASVTKLFTAISVMRLVEDGLVDLDEPIGTYVPEMEGRHYPGSRPPTVRDLMTHHGGISSDILKGNIYDGPEAGYGVAFMDHIPLIAEQPMTEPPRTLAHYSNLDYLLLGALVANVGGEPYVDFVGSHILEPIGMRDSGFFDPEHNSKASKGFASGKEVPMLRLSGGPEGGLAASAADLGRFMSMILSAVSGSRADSVKPVLSAASVREMLRRQNADVALDFDYEMGLGFRLMSLPGYPDVRLAWHDGGTYPFASTLLVAPDYGVGVAIVSNTNETVPEELAYDAIARVITARGGAVHDKVPGYQFGEMAGRPLEANELAGTYMSEVGPIVVGGTPKAPLATLHGMRLSLVKREGPSYGLQMKVLGFIPLRIGQLERLRVVFRAIDGRRVLAIYEYGKFRSVALAVEPQPVPAAWQARFGHYVAANPDLTPFFLGADLGFDEKLGFMTISVAVAASPDPFVFALVAKDETIALTAGLGRRMGDTFRIDSHDGRELIRWAGLELQRE